MNRERAKELLPIIEAYANGEDIQFHNGDGWSDIGKEIEADCLDDGGLQYRIKPKPREWWIADVTDEFRKVLLPGQKDLSADHQYIKVREVLE